MLMRVYSIYMIKTAPFLFEDGSLCSAQHRLELKQEAPNRTVFLS